MNKAYRKRTEISVAFSSGLNGLRSKEPISLEQLTEFANNDSGSISFRVRIKKLLRSVARFTYQSLKPAIRPIAFRIRRYFTADLQNTMQTILEETLNVRDRLHQTCISSLEHIQHEQRLHKTQFHQDQPIFSATLKEIPQQLAAALQQIQAKGDAMLQQIQQASTAILQKNERVLNSQLIKERDTPSYLDYKIQILQSQIDMVKTILTRVEQYSLTTARRVAISCGEGEILIRTDIGYVVCSVEDRALLACLIESGELEPGTRQLIQRFLHPGNIFVDVGANIGMHTLAAAHALKGTGKIIAFEPFEPTANLLRKSVLINGFSKVIEIHQVAVSNMKGLQKLFLGETSGHHSLFPLNSLKSEQNPIEVPIVTLADMLPKQRIDLIKIDVEGAELEVIEGGKVVIVDNPDIALIVEFGRSHLKRTKHTVQQWLKSFEDLDLCYKVINEVTGVLEDYSLEQLENRESANLFFARKNSSAWEKAAV